MGRLLARTIYIPTMSKKLTKMFLHCQRKQERIKNVLSVYQTQASQVLDQHFAVAAS